MTETLWVVGGEQRVQFSKPKEWTQYRKAMVIEVRDGRPQEALAYESPPERCPDGETPSHVFKAATFEGDTAYLCTQTEVLVCDFPGFRIRRVISLPCFNDLHHVAPAPDGRLFVAVTGLDAVAELTPEGELIRLVSVLGGSPWDRFSPDVDYRKVPTTKPHRAHPNFIFFLDGRPWVTRFNQRDAVPVDGVNGRPPFDIGSEEGVHDGHIVDDGLFFTTVSGCVVRFDLATGEKTVFDLNRLNEPDEDRPLGWCRGVLPVGDGRQAWVGFSRLRYTTLRRNLSWVRHGFRETEHHRERPTRIALYDLRCGRPDLRRQIDLEGVRMGAVFSIHSA